MGQQQLLLVILVTIIVGIATVVAINTFGSAADSANIDAVRQDIATFAASAQGYFMKPEMLGGGGGDWAGITFNTVAFPADEVATNGLTALNANGVYTFAAPADTDTTFTVTAYPASRIDGPVTLTVTSAGGNGPLVADIGPGGITWVEND
ncbi:MAG: hypothetical protein HUJ22_03890 [Gracilimonas sp.]|uniref:hypothetical protein n=1 Tax=Gracilimonas sp. TaxID=1974203 RepID=UPI0019CE472C|nr:hypothetical protein [Gracilimonas sp.]MBD3615691.1 hypothetical protein [Gracilimonas sp.]